MLTATACIEEKTSGSSLIEAGDVVPGFAVYTADSTLVSNNSLKGHRAVIVFFNTSCADCRRELPCVDSLYRAMKDEPEFKLVCIARDEEKPSIERFWKEKGLTMPYAPQSGRDVYNLFAKSIIPRIYICTREGVVRFIFGDRDMPSFETLHNTINAL